MTERQNYLAEGFRNVDRQSDVEKFKTCLAFLDSLPSFRTYKEESCQLLSPGKGTMNVAGTAGFAVLCAAFWRSSDRNGTDAENENPYRDLRHHAVSGLSDPGMMPKKRGSHAADRWGPAPTIGFLNE